MGRDGNMYYGSDDPNDRQLIKPVPKYDVGAEVFDRTQGVFDHTKEYHNQNLGIKKLPGQNSLKKKNAQPMKNNFLKRPQSAQQKTLSKRGVGNNASVENITTLRPQSSYKEK